MKTYEPMAGENVNETAKRMVALAKKTKGPVTAKFNDIALTAKPGDNHDTIVLMLKGALETAPKKMTSETRRAGRRRSRPTPTATAAES